MHEEYEDTAQLARRTKTSDSYWNKMRVAGEGPSFIKLGRRVLYRPSVVDEWLATMTRSSTSEAPVELVHRLNRDGDVEAPAAVHVCDRHVVERVENVRQLEGAGDADLAGGPEGDDR